MSFNMDILTCDDDYTKKKLHQMSFWIDILSIIVQTVNDLSPLCRSPSVNIQRLLWRRYIDANGNNDKFIKRQLRMSLDSFYKLLGYVKKDLLVNELQANRRGGAISPEICLFCTIRWLAGGSYLDIYSITGVSTASFYRVVYKTIYYLNKCKELEIYFPSTVAECDVLAAGFENISYKSAITNCIGAIDGYLLRIHTPSKKEAGNVRGFFSGHYQCSGINVQAVCDAHCRFTLFSVVAPGSMNDRSAVLESDLPKLLKDVPKGYVIIADCAYEPSEQVVPMYYGVSKKKAEFDNYNFYASQCRIRIEMSFGLMQMKWGILWKPLKVKLDNVKHIMTCIGRLHNFVINERLLSNSKNGINHHYNSDEQLVGTGYDDRSYLPTNITTSEGDPIGVECDGFTSHIEYSAGISEIRDFMASRIKSLQLMRPFKNIINKRKHDDIDD